MAKKSKISRQSSAKTEVNEAVEEETVEMGTGINVPKGGAGIVEFYHLFGGIGILLTIVMILYIVLHYLLHIV